MDEPLHGDFYGKNGRGGMTRLGWWVTPLGSGHRSVPDCLVPSAG